MVRIFVYGTLKQGFPNFHFMHNPKNGVAKFVCNAVTVKKYPLVVAGTAKIPFILNQEGIGERVCGEIFEVDEQMQKCLDNIERVGAFYDVKRLEVISEFDQLEVCPTYVLNDFHDHLLKLPMLPSYSGRWVEMFVPRNERPHITLEDLIKEVKRV